MSTIEESEEWSHRLTERVEKCLETRTQPPGDTPYVEWPTYPRDPRYGVLAARSVRRRGTEVPQNSAYLETLGGVGGEGEMRRGIPTVV